MFSKKEVKAQVTTFVIIGIIVLILIGIFFTVKEYQNRNQPVVPDKEKKEIGLIKEQIEGCLSDVSKEALIRAGEQSGYVNLPSSLRYSPLPYESDIFINEIFTLPYWYHYNKEGFFKTHKPALCDYDGDCPIQDFGESSIQKNVETYILENIDSCLDDFNEYEDKYSIKELDEKKVNVQIVEDKVIVKMSYPLSITIYETEDVLTIDSYLAEHDVDLLQLFTLAMNITEAEANTHFLEDNVMNLITAYSNLDSEKLPPISDISFLDFSKEYWIRRDIEEKMRYEVLPFMGLTKIVNTLNSEPAIAHVDAEYYPFAQGFYNSFLADIGIEEPLNYEIDIYYPDSEILFFIDNGEEIIKPKTLEGFNKYLQSMFKMIVQDYSYDYNLAFPIIVTITDPEAFNNQEYSFSFALEVNIKNNIPLTQNMTFRRDGASPTLRIEDPHVLVDKEITVKITDKHTGEPVKDTIIYYNCGTDFFVGETEIINNEAIVTAKMPYCAVGGYLKAVKDDYASAFKNYNNIEDNLDPISMELEMWPVVNKTLKFYKRTKQDLENMKLIEHKLQYKTELSTKDELMININKVKDDPREEAFPLVGFILATNPNVTSIAYNYETQHDQIKELYESGDINRSIYDSLTAQLDKYDVSEEIELMHDYNMELVPGNYSIDMTLMTNGPFNIPEKTEEICVGQEMPVLGCIGEIQEVTYKEMNLSMWVTGEYNFNITLQENRIYNDGGIIFFVPFLDAPKTWDEIEDYNLQEYTPNIDEWKLIPYYE